MYISIMDEGNNFLVSRMHPSAIVIRAIEFGTKQVVSFFMYAKDNSALEQEIDIYIRRSSIKYAASVREHFRLLGT